jgi:hypothetical protein
VVAALDVAELLSETGRLDESVQAFDRLRTLVDLPEHEVCVLHGMVGVDLRRDDTAGAVSLAREAAAIDQHGRTRQLLAYLNAKEGKPTEGDEFVPPPSEGDVQDAIASSLMELRRYHVEQRGGSLG